MRGLVLFAALIAGVVGLAAAFHGDLPKLSSHLDLSFDSASASPPAARPAPTGPCPTDPLAPAVTPTLAISSAPDADGRPARYGTLQYPRGSIAPMQIALTIDDGPDAINHTRVLDILDKHCLKATFFFVGILANTHPELVRDTAARGHTIGTHSWTHPNNMRRLSASGQVFQITQGFKASEAALQTATPAQQAQLSPFFRFPGLNDSPTMLAYLGQRKIAVLSSDFGADDWKPISSAEVERRALRDGAESRGGVLILHESRAHTVAVLDELITAFEQRGYHFVQLIPTPGARDVAAAAPDPLLSAVGPAKPTKPAG